MLAHLKSSFQIHQCSAHCTSTVQKLLRLQCSPPMGAHGCRRVVEGYKEEGREAKTFCTTCSLRRNNCVLWRLKGKAAPQKWQIRLGFWKSQNNMCWAYQVARLPDSTRARWSNIIFLFWTNLYHSIEISLGSICFWCHISPWYKITAQLMVSWVFEFKGSLLISQWNYCEFNVSEAEIYLCNDFQTRSTKMCLWIVESELDFRPWSFK